MLVTKLGTSAFVEDRQEDASVDTRWCYDDKHVGAFAEEPPQALKVPVACDANERVSASAPAHSERSSSFPELKLALPAQRAPAAAGPCPDKEAGCTYEDDRSPTWTAALFTALSACVRGAVNVAQRLDGRNADGTARSVTSSQTQRRSL